MLAPALGRSPSVGQKMSVYLLPEQNSLLQKEKRRPSIITALNINCAVADKSRSLIFTVTLVYMYQCKRRSHRSNLG